MGTTYSNCQVRSDSQEAVVAALRGLLKEPAYVAAAVNGWVGVYPEGVRTDPDDEYAPPPNANERKRVKGKPEAFVPYCLPGVGYSQVKEVLHPPLLGEDESNGATMPSKKSLQLFSNLLKITPEAMKSNLSPFLKGGALTLLTQAIRLQARAHP
jgi:hypothetical protein